MKIGIMTLYGTQENYGAVLQCYALQEYLRKAGHEPFLIRYNEVTKGINLKTITLGKILKFLLQRVKKLTSKKILDEPRYFDDFITSNINVSAKEYKTYFELQHEPPEADMYIVGSDQVWNFYDHPIKFCRNRIHSFFLDFGSLGVKRFSYAASWDRKYVSDEQLQELMPLIQQFDYVSVREETGLELCKRCGIDNAEWVPDPTLLLKADDYRNLYNGKNIRKISQKYLLVYLVLQRKNPYDLSTIYDFAQSKEVEVVFVTEDNVQTNFKKYYPTIYEWLYLIDNAEYVITNSFHGTAFSLIFHKQFATIPLTGYSSSTNSRIDSIFKLFGIESRFFIDNDFSMLEKNYVEHFKFPDNNFTKYIVKASKDFAGKSPVE